MNCAVPEGARRAELERLTRAAGPERAWQAYRWLQGSDEHRATQVDVFVEACTWHPDAPTFGGALSLARALPLDSPDLPVRMAELERLVSASNPDQGLLAFRELSESPELRRRQIDDYVEICSWNPNLSRFGGASRVMRFLDARPEEERADALATVGGLPWGEDYLGYEGAMRQMEALEKLPGELVGLLCRAREVRDLSRVAEWFSPEHLPCLQALAPKRALELLEAVQAPSVEELAAHVLAVARSEGPVEHVLEVERYRARPVGGVGEDDACWVIAGTVLPKRVSANPS